MQTRGSLSISSVCNLQILDNVPSHPEGGSGTTVAMINLVEFSPFQTNICISHEVLFSFSTHTSLPAGSGVIVVTDRYDALGPQPELPMRRSYMKPCGPVFSWPRI